jgi:hypothetical protein
MYPTYKIGSCSSSSTHCINERHVWHSRTTRLHMYGHHPHLASLLQCCPCCHAAACAAYVPCQARVCYHCLYPMRLVGSQRDVADASPWQCTSHSHSNADDACAVHAVGTGPPHLTPEERRDCQVVCASTISKGLLHALEVHLVPVPAAQQTYSDLSWFYPGGQCHSCCGERAHV